MESSVNRVASSSIVLLLPMAWTARKARLLGRRRRRDDLESNNEAPFSAQHACHAHHDFDPSYPRTSSRE